MGEMTSIRRENQKERRENAEREKRSEKSLEDLKTMLTDMFTIINKAANSRQPRHQQSQPGSPIEGGRDQNT